MGFHRAFPNGTFRKTRISFTFVDLTRPRIFYTHHNAVDATVLLLLFRGIGTKRFTRRIIPTKYYIPANE